jgi:hypothetical protein
VEQRTAIGFLTLKGLKTKEIQTEPAAVYGTETCRLTAVKKCRTRFLHSKTHFFENPRPEKALMQDRVEGIRSMLVEKPFSSYKVLCHRFRITKATYVTILHNNLGIQKLHLR